MDRPGPSSHPSTSTFGKKGLILHCQAREVIANVITFMKNEAEHYKTRHESTIPLTNFRERILAATGISHKLYRTIVKESQDIKSGKSVTFTTPRRKRRQSKKAYKLVEDDKHAIRNMIHEVDTYKLVEDDKNAIRNMIHEFHMTEQNMPIVKVEIVEPKIESYE